MKESQRLLSWKDGGLFSGAGREVYLMQPLLPGTKYHVLRAVETQPPERLLGS